MHALAAPGAPDASQLRRTQQQAFVKCSELPGAESEPCMLSLLQVAESKHSKGEKKVSDGRDKRGGHGILLPKSAFDQHARKLAGKASHRPQHPPRARGFKGKTNLADAGHGPKWEARYGVSDEQGETKQAAVKRLSQKQVPGADDPPPVDYGQVPGEDDPDQPAPGGEPAPAEADTGAEAAAAARAEASGADAPTAKVDDTDYQESDASENPDQPLPAPAVCTGPGAVAGDPACASVQYPNGVPGAVPDAAAPVAAADSAAPAECIATMAGVSDEWCVTNCAIDNCPANMCDCSGGVEEEVDPDRPVCLSIAPNVSDDWCQTNCEAWVRHEEGFFNCPPSQCKCTEHESQAGEGASAAAGMGYMKAPDADAPAPAPQ